MPSPCNNAMLRRASRMLGQVYDEELAASGLRTTQHSLLAQIDKMKDAQIVMITYLPYAEMIEFYKKYNIAHYPQITMARDTKFFFPVFFKVRNLPSIYVYDKKGDFKRNFEGSVRIDLLSAAL